LGKEKLKICHLLLKFWQHFSRIETFGAFIHVPIIHLCIATNHNGLLIISPLNPKPQIGQPLAKFSENLDIPQT